MNRQASIHVSEKHLQLAIEEISGEYNLSELTPKRLARLLCAHSKPFALTKRAFNITTARLEKKAEKIKASGLSEAYLFNRLLVSIRKQNHHRGITQLNESHKDWGILKEITAQAMEFCKMYGLKKKAGFTEYINIGMAKMAKFSLYKLKGMHEGICDSFGAKADIYSDPTPGITRAYHDIYVRIVVEKTSMPLDYTKNVDKYQCFYKAKLIGESLKARPEDFIKAQFHALGWVNGVPDPLQLTTEKARERYIKYAFEMNIQMKKEVKRFTHLDKFRNYHD